MDDESEQPAPDTRHAMAARPLSLTVHFAGAPAAGTEAPALEGHLTLHTDGTLHPGVVLCHANPAAGGHMDMDVMLALEKALVEAGFATLRYNSRGIGGSEGSVSQVEGNK